MNKRSGQNLVEFAILISILVLGSIAVVSTLGVQVSDLFTNSNAKFSGYKPFGNGSNQVASTGNNTSNPTDPNNTSDPSNPSDPSDPNNTSDPTNVVSGGTLLSSVDGVDIYENTDGSVAFQIGNQQVTLPKEMIQKQNTVFDSAGSSGTEKLVQMIAYMIEQHKDEYPNDVPIEISYGKSDRSYYKDSINTPVFSNTGTAEVNMVSLQVGNHVLIYENDQVQSDYSQGTFDIEGYIDDGVFNASIRSDDNTSLNGQSIAMDVNDSGDFNLNGNLSAISVQNQMNTGSLEYDVNWDLNFPGDADNNFQIGG